jgi:hexosaminidase
LLKEASPVSRNLSALGAAGLEALEYIDKAEPAGDSWHRAQIAIVQAAEKPTADLSLAIAPAVQKLVDASAQIKR